MAKQKCTKCKEKFDTVLCQCCQTRLYVDNALLMYVSSYVLKAARLNIKNVVLNTFSSDVITTARQVMEDSVRELVPNHPAIGVKRADSAKRSASDAMVDDILDLFGGIDKLQDVTLPVFMCSDAKNLPPTGPEEAGSLMIVLETLAVQQRQIKQMQEMPCHIVI